MPINPTTLKALIDTQITNETVNFAITPAEVGGRMKDTIDYTTEQIAASELLANKSTNVATDGLSNTKYPSVKAVKDYADGIVVGLLDDRGNYDASSNLFPATGGSGVAGAVLKGDLWYISVTGTLGGVSVPVGASVRALVDTPAQTSTNWSILNVGLGFTPENVANKSTDVTTDGASDTKYPSVKAIKDYVDASSGGVPLTSGAINLNATPQVLPFDINSCATQGGKAFLPATTEIGKQVYVFAVQDNIEISANSAGTSFMFVKFQTFIPSVTLLNKQMYMFTYVGFGSGAGGTVGGYWLAELIEFEIPTFKAFITQAGSATPIFSTISKNTTGKTFTIARQNAGVFLIEPNVPFTNIEKVFITIQNQGGYNVINTISLSNEQIFLITNNFSGVAADLIDYSTITIDILP
jgi:hypothetical protein